jgi:hypothetical protein
MDRRTQAVTAQVAAALQDVPTSTVSEATGIPSAHLEDIRHGRVEANMSDLVKVGGFCHVRPESFLGGVA